ncbi:hypothetical protein D3C84_990610 [compost metagenome]
MHQTVQRCRCRPVPHLLDELLIDELEAFRRSGDVHPVAQPIGLVAHPGNDLAPGLLRLDCAQHVELIDQGMTDLETDNRLRLLHRPAYHRASVLLAAVNVNFMVRLIDLSAKPPVLRHLFHGWIEDVADLSVSRSEVTGVDARPLPEVFADG